MKFGMVFEMTQGCRQVTLSHIQRHYSFMTLLTDIYSCLNFRQHYAQLESELKSVHHNNGKVTIKSRPNTRNTGTILRHFRLKTDVKEP